MEQALVLFNTLSNTKERFTAKTNEIGLYCCGPTVYNYAHTGNLRTYVFEDILKRVLLSCGYKVTHVINITDVGHLTSDADSGDDKMEKGASREGKTVWEIAEHYTKAFMNDIRDLNILEADIWPKATDHIPEMIAMVQKLEENGVTYRTEDGIYFDTSKFPRYGDFARLDIDALQAGSRIDMGEKKNKTDFALWKFSPKNTKRQMEWESPWGIGFPGWHIECSAMSLKYLNQPIDIHCGGTDHIRIHHTNEIAQVEASTGKTFVRVWMHGEFLVRDSGKMSKSSGNFITLVSLKQAGIDPLAYRLFCFSAHYRSPLTYSQESIDAAAATLKNLRSLVTKETSGAGDTTVSVQRVEELLAAFWAALYDDLNMPKAMAAVWEIIRSSSYSAAEKKTAFEKADTILALDLFAALPQQVVVQDTATNMAIRFVSEQVLSAEEMEEIRTMVIARNNERKNKNFKEADRLRDELSACGITIKDLKDGTTECVVTGK